MDTYDFYGEFTLGLTGASEVVQKLRDTYEYFEADVSGPPDLVCTAATEPPTPDLVLGGDDDYYGRAGDEFVIQRSWGEQMVISKDWDRIAVSAEAVHHHVAYIIEFEVRKRLASKGRALIHASGVHIDGSTFAFPAWRHAGKTSTMLSLLRSGGDYLADDRLWVESDGRVRGYPLPVNVMPSNTDMFEDVATTNGVEKVRTEVSDFIFAQVDVDRSLLDKVVYFLTKYYLDVEFDTVLVPVEALASDSQFVSGPDRLDALVLLRTTLEPAGDGIEVNPVTPEAALTDVVNVNFYEWNKLLMEYFTAYDMLFTGGNRTAQLQGLIDEEVHVVSRLLDRTPTYRALIPRSRDWTETGIEEEVVECVSKLRQSPSVGH